MSRIYLYSALAILFSVTLACSSLTARSVPPTETPTLAPTSAPLTATETAVAATNTAVATETTQAATISPLLTNIPGIAETLTAVYSTPGAESTLVAQQTVIAATLGSQLNGFSGDLLSQCPNPNDPPMQSWLNVPVMPQATAGQVVQTLIGSYYCFRVPVTAGEVDAFYKEKLSAPNWVMQADANGSMEFVGISQTGAQLLFVVYGPSNKNDTLVALNVTRPMAFPTPQP